MASASNAVAKRHRFEMAAGREAAERGGVSASAASSGSSHRPPLRTLARQYFDVVPHVRILWLASTHWSLMIHMCGVLQLEMCSRLASHGRNVSAECRLMVRGVRSVREALLHGGNAALVAELLERELHSKYGGLSARPPPRATHRLQTRVCLECLLGRASARMSANYMWCRRSGFTCCSGAISPRS